MTPSIRNYKNTSTGAVVFIEFDELHCDTYRYAVLSPDGTCYHTDHLDGAEEVFERRCKELVVAYTVVQEDVIGEAVLQLRDYGLDASFRYKTSYNGTTRFFSNGLVDIVEMYTKALEQHASTHEADLKRAAAKAEREAKAEADVKAAAKIKTRCTDKNFITLDETMQVLTKLKSISGHPSSRAGMSYNISAPDLGGLVQVHAVFLHVGRCRMVLTAFSSEQVTIRLSKTSGDIQRSRIDLPDCKGIIPLSEAIQSMEISGSRFSEAYTAAFLDTYASLFPYKR